MSTDKHGTSRTPYLYIFQAAKNYPADFSHLSAIFVVFNLPEVSMIGSRVTVDAPRGRKQLGAFGKMCGLSSRLFLSFPAPPPCH